MESWEFKPAFGEHAVELQLPNNKALIPPNVMSKPMTLKDLDLIFIKVCVLWILIYINIP